MFKNYPTMIMRFKERAYDHEGNPKFDKNSNPLYQYVERVVRHNPGYFPKK